MNVKKGNRVVFVSNGERMCSNFALKIGPENRIALLNFILHFSLIEVIYCF